MERRKMRNGTRLFRLTTSVAIAALLGGTVLPPRALAQPAPSGPDTSAADKATQADPPERVGRLARMAGTVSFHTQDDTQWSPASVNYPVSTGDAFWTEPNAQADLEISASRIALNGGTEFDIDTLDANGLQATSRQGTTYLHLRDLAPGENWSVQTPRGLVRLMAPGHYEIAAGTTDTPTTVTVVDGAASVEGPGVSLQVRPGEIAAVTGSDTFQGSVGPGERDPFLTAQLERERPPRPPAVAPPPQVAEMPGGGDLSAYGNWGSAPEYGPVWYPPVSPEWVPYREGHWAFVPPWGWTWVDDAPWGFAPFHYGRWVTIGGRWCWTPGYASAGYRPVYAPALVTFIGIGAGVAVGVGFGAALASHSIGWVPLGPREPYRPWYHASDRYFRQVNVTHVTNVTHITTINRNVTINNFVNHRAVTVVPASAMTASRPVTRAMQHVSPQQLAAARPVVGQEPLRPTRATSGVTPAVARQMNLAPVVGGPPARPAPGPAIRTPPPGGPHTARTSVPAARPPLAAVHGTGAPPGVREPGGAATPRPALAQPAAQRPAEPHLSGPGSAGSHSVPALVAPGAHGRPAVPGAAPGPAFTPHHGAGVAADAQPNRPATEPAHGLPRPNAMPTVQGPPAQPHGPSPGQPGSQHPPALAQAPHPATPAEPAPRRNSPPEVAQPSPAMQAAAPPHVNAPGQFTHQPMPAAAAAPQVAHPSPPTVVHAPPPVVHQPTAAAAPHFNPPPQVAHLAPPPAVHQPTPAAAPHFNPPPPQAAHATPPQFHAPPAQHAPLAQHAPPPQQHEKRPGEK